MEKRTRWQIHSILVKSNLFPLFYELFEKGDIQQWTDFNSERACSQKVVNIDDCRAEEGSDELLPGGRGGKAPGEDAQEGVQKAEEETVLICVSGWVTHRRRMMQMETQAPLNVFVAPELWNADRDGDWGNISHRPRVCRLVLCSTTWYH